MNCYEYCTGLKDGNKDGWGKNSHYLSCDLHTIGENIYSKLPVKKFSSGWVDGLWSRVKDCLQQSKNPNEG